MWGIRKESKWQSILNPFLNVSTSEVITGHVSGRSTDITEIITEDQNAFIIAGAPSIGKSALIRYLQQPPNTEWSWRDELAVLRDRLKLNEIHFVQIDLAPLEDVEDVDKLLDTFIKQCATALQSVYLQDKQTSSFGFDLKGVRKLLRSINQESLDARYFLMLDTIKRLDQPGPLQSVAQTPQERALAILDHCGAIHTLVDLIDEFSIFGVILALESLPRPRIGHQFSHVSADLARFTTMTLQTFTWEDVTAFLAQEPENFGIIWADRFKELGKSSIFSQAEQEWLREQAGTHPHLLHQFCYHTFDFKREHASICDTWTELQESDKKQLIEWLDERLSTFLARIWKRLQKALETSSVETRSNFSEFISLLTQKSTNDIIDAALWDHLGSELRYILYSEGVLRYDPFQPIHYPGSTLRNYLIQKAKENTESSISQSLVPTVGRKLSIHISEKQSDRLLLSELEYGLLKTLLQHPQRCTEEELMKGAWNRLIDKPVFTQRMHHLRKKLKERCEGVEIIENRYGGLYSLNHPEWFHLE